MAYIKKEEFSKFVKGQEKLVNILNHNITKIQTDVTWIKKIVWAGIGLLSAIFLSLLTQL